MGTWTLLALGLRVQNIVVDEDVAVTARVYPEIRDAQYDIEDRPYKFTFQETRINPNPTVSVGDAEVASVPIDWLSPHGDPILVDPTAGQGMVMPPLRWAELDEELLKVHSGAFQNEDTSSRDQPEVLYIDRVDEKIRVFPVPDDTYTLWVPYYKRLTNMILTAQTNLWTQSGNLQNYLVYRAAARVLDYMRDQAEALKYEIKAEAAYRAAKRADKRKRFRTQGSRIRPRRDVGGLYTQRRM